MKKTVLLLIGLTLMLLAANANAVIFGIRYSDMGKPVVSAFGNDLNSGRFGVYVGQGQKKSDFLIGLDYDRFKQERGDTLSYARRFVVDIGYRYKLMAGDRASAMRISPFAAMHYYRSFAKVKADSSVLSEEDRKYYQDMYNDQGGWISAGIEYYPAPVFSVGCEAGLRYTSAKSKAYGYTIKVSEYRVFTAILLSFRF